MVSACAYNQVLYEYWYWYSTIGHIIGASHPSAF
jgi:hypothetical protein